MNELAGKHKQFSLEKRFHSYAKSIHMLINLSLWFFLIFMFSFFFFFELVPAQKLMRVFEGRGSSDLGNWDICAHTFINSLW